MRFLLIGCGTFRFVRTAVLAMGVATALWLTSSVLVRAEDREDDDFPTIPSDATLIFDSDDLLDDGTYAPSDDSVECDETENADGPTPSKILESCDVLIDMRHAHDFSDFPLTLDDRLYHRIYSFNSAFAYLRSQGVSVAKYEEDAPLTPEVLSRCGALFLNLPSADKEPFLLSELVAIRDYISNGGSAFFIVDHTNCYFHQSRLKPLFTELEIEPQFYGVCDKVQNLGSGYGWIYFDVFSDSPLTRGLRKIAFQTGGGVDPENAVVWSSENSWQDAAGMPIYGEADLAYFGNFQPDDGERVGASGVVLAKNFGKGKIAIVGDQNLFSAFFLQYLDNYRLWINSFAWLLERPELADVETYVNNAKKGKLLVCWEELARGEKRFGDPDPNGYYNIYSNLCRRYNPFCVAWDDSDVGLESKLALAIECGANYSQEGVEFLASQLRHGGTAIVLDPAVGALDDKRSGVARALETLARERVVFEREEGADAGTNSTEKNYREKVTLSNGGALILLRGKESFDNSNVPAPEARALFFQYENIKTLLKEIDVALQSEPAPEIERAPAPNSGSLN